MLFQTKTPFYHFSIDDVFDSLIAIKNSRTSLFTIPLFKYLKSLHTKYGTTVNLNLFYQKNIDGKIYTLKEVPNLQKEMIVSRANRWLFFAPHSLDYDTAPYKETTIKQIQDFKLIYKEIKRFAGESNFARFPRLHYYSELYELADFFHKKGVVGLFSTDRNILTHRMGKKEKRSLKLKGYTKFNKIYFISTQFRIEFFTKTKKKTITKQLLENIKKYKFVTFYTHEKELLKKNICQKINYFLEQLKTLSVLSIKKP